MPRPVQFVAHTQTHINALNGEEIYNLVHQALEISNKLLQLEGTSVVFVQQLSPRPPEERSLNAQYNMLLGLDRDGQIEEIDMIDVKALDEISIKSSDLLAEEIAKKVKQHIEATKTQGIISVKNSGYKLDVRKLDGYKVSIDGANYLTVNDHRIALKTNSEEYWPLQASVFRSYTIARWIHEGNQIRIFDDHDLCRKDEKGMLLNVTKVHSLAIEQLVERARPMAEDYRNGYYLLQRDTITPQLKNRLCEVLANIAVP